MRFLVALAASQSLGLFLGSDAFCPSSSSISAGRRRFALNVGSWDNDDFLDGLSGKNDNSEDGADDLPEEGIPGAELTEEQKQKIREQNEQEEFNGGSRFKELLDAAKQAQGTGTTPVENPFAANPFAGIEGLDPAAGTAATPNVNLDEMTVEEQAEMFRQMMQGKKTAPVQASQDFVIPPLPKPPAPDRKAGRNRDADTIQNTADVYFAQLKRDSTVRGIARIRGDNDKANEVFKDEKIKELDNMIKENPHLANAREKEKALIETAQEEMMAMQMALERKQSENPDTSGISYKQKLAERRKQKKSGGTTSFDAPSVPTEEAPQTQPTPPVAQAPVPPAVETPPVPEAPPAAKAPSVTGTPSSAKAPPTPEPIQKQPQPAVQQPAQGSPSSPQQHTSSNAVTANSNPDEIRKNIRTLMGLIIKHRGGPGFGAGGLKGKEIAQYEELMNEVTALLKEEAKLHTGKESTPSAESPSPASPASSVYSPPHPTSVGQSAGLSTVPNSPSDGAQIDSMLACIEGAVLMYRNSPPELKEGVLMQIRAALLSAVNTCNKVMGQHDGIPSSTQGAGTQVDSMFACVEGAILMYRNSPPELKEGVLMTLRAALLSALNTCNKIIAEKEVENYKQYQEATAGMERPASTKPTQFYDVSQEVSEEKAQQVSTGNDENSKILETIYTKLEAAAGDGKLGLREKLSPEDASDLADSLVEMRSIMMDELETGIPVSSGSSQGNPTDSAGSSTASAYQQMLAKARASKE